MCLLAPTAALRRGAGQCRPATPRAGSDTRHRGSVGSILRRTFLACRGSSLGGAMSWHLRGSYVETCSCELMCPCNLSFDHGATYDFCRVTLVFNIREGAVDDTDIAGCRVAIIADTPKVM